MATKDMGQICDMTTIAVNESGQLFALLQNLVDNSTVFVTSDGKLTTDATKAASIKEAEK